MKNTLYPLISLLILTLLQAKIVAAETLTGEIRINTIIEIPIIVTHIIPLDHVDFDIPVVGITTATLGLREEYAKKIEPGINSLGRTMLMNELIATGDNQNYWNPKQFKNGQHSYRARSLYIIEYDPSTEEFSVQDNDVDCYISARKKTPQTLTHPSL